MQFRRLLRDEGAVSPVIGVILMVAITVILAAILGSLVLGVEQSVAEPAPHAQFTTDYASQGNDTLTITHDGGATIPAARLNASVEGALAINSSGDTYPATYLGTENGSGAEKGLYGAAGDVEAGDSHTLDLAQFGIVDPSTGNMERLSDLAAAGHKGEFSLREATVRVVWTAQDGETSAKLYEWTGPGA